MSEAEQQTDGPVDANGETNEPKNEGSSVPGFEGALEEVSNESDDNEPDDDDEAEPDGDE